MNEEIFKYSLREAKEKRENVSWGSQSKAPDCTQKTVNPICKQMFQNIFPFRILRECFCAKEKCFPFARNFSLDSIFIQQNEKFIDCILILCHSCPFFTLPDEGTSSDERKIEI